MAKTTTTKVKKSATKPPSATVKTSSTPGKRNVKAAESIQAEKKQKVKKVAAVAAAAAESDAVDESKDDVEEEEEERTKKAKGKAKAKTITAKKLDGDVPSKANKPAKKAEAPKKVDIKAKTVEKEKKPAPAKTESSSKEKKKKKKAPSPSPEASEQDDEDDNVYNDNEGASEKEDEDASAPAASDDDDDDDEEVLLHGFSSESDSSDEDEDDNVDKAPIDVGKLPTVAKDDASVQRKLERAKKQASESRGVLYLGRIPHGFYEDQMRAYFAQFGDVTRVRLSRNKKSGASKHYGFIEFSSSAVAEIVAETMDNYLLLGHILRCKIIPKDEVHPSLWVGANRKFRRVPAIRVERLKQNKSRTEEEKGKAERRLLKRQEVKKRKLQSVGIEYDFSKTGYKKSKQDV